MAAPTATKRTKKPATAKQVRATESNGNGHGATGSTMPAGIAKTEPAAAAPDLRTRMAAFRSTNVCVHQIRRWEGQPRKTFDMVEIATLAESIKQVGLIEPLVVRPDPQQPNGKPHYLLVAGERRHRALELIGGKTQTVPCHLVELSDAEALAIATIENVERQDLNPIEEAAAWRRLTDPEGPEYFGSQAQLAEQLKLSPAQISNRIRLLELPPEFQKLVVSREMPATHARTVLPYVKHADLRKPLLKAWADCVKREGRAPALSEWEDEIDWKARCATAEISGSTWNGRSHVKWSIPNSHHAQLRVVELDGEQRALNVKLAKQLRKEALDAAAERAEARKNGKKKGDKPQRTPAEQKKVDKQRAEAFERRLTAWLRNWQRWLIHEDLAKNELVEAKEGAFTAQGCRLVLSLMGNSQAGGEDPVLDAMHRLQLAKGKKKPARSWMGSADGLWADMGKIPDARMHEVLVDVLQGCFWQRPGEFGPDEPGPARGVQDWEVAEIAAAFAIDLKAAWEKERAGPLTREYYELHDKGQLLALTKAWKLPWTEKAKKSELVDALSDPKSGDWSATRKIPAELLKVAKA